MKLDIKIIAVGLIIFVIGTGAGFVFGIKGERQINVQDSLIIPELTKQEMTLRRLLNHSALDSVCSNINGEVAEIGENMIVIIQNQEKLELKVDPGAHIARFIVSGDPEVDPIREVITFDQIKIGEQINIYAVITEEGEISARGINLQQQLTN